MIALISGSLTPRLPCFVQMFKKSKHSSGNSHHKQKKKKQKPAAMEFKERILGNNYVSIKLKCWKQHCMQMYCRFSWALKSIVLSVWTRGVRMSVMWWGGTSLLSLVWSTGGSRALGHIREHVGERVHPEAPSQASGLQGLCICQYCRMQTSVLTVGNVLWRRWVACLGLCSHIFSGSLCDETCGNSWKMLVV